MVNENYEIAIVETQPLLKVNIDSIAKKVKEEIDALKLETIAATDENKKILTEKRINLNNQKKQFETDRKLIKQTLLAPYELFESEYKEKILSLYDESLVKINDALTSITTREKQVLKDYAIKYFLETKGARGLIEDVAYDERKLDLTNNKRIRESIDKLFDSLEKDLKIIATYGEQKNRLHILWRTNDYDLQTALIKMQTELRMENELREQKEANARKIEEEQKWIIDADVSFTKEIEFTTPQAQPIVEQPATVSEVYEYNLQLQCTYEEASELAKYLADKGIEFEWK